LTSRSFATAQQRLVKGLRLAGAGTLEQANRYLHQVYLPMWNQRFIRTPASSLDAHRPLLPGHDLKSILSRQTIRQITNGYTVQLDNCTYQIHRDDARPALRRTAVLIEQRLDGTFAFRTSGGYLRFLPCHEQPAPIHTPRTPRQARPPRTHDWMQNFDLKDTPPLWHALK
jgi:hypothetical protein